MASFYSDAFLYKQPSTTTTYSTTISLPSRPKLHLRRRRGERRLPTAQLGGKKARHGFFLARVFKRAKVKWVKLRNSCILKRLKQYYKSMIKDMIDASATVEAHQQRVLMETSLALPTIGVSFSNFHGGSTLTTPTSVFI